MIDTTEVLKMALMDDGQPATIGGAEIASGVLFNQAASESDPYRSEGNGLDCQTAVALQADLAAIGEWPLSSTDLETDDHVYRVIRHNSFRGEVTLYLREAN